MAAYFQPMSYTELSMEEERLETHGTYEMPVWGFAFQRSDPEDVVRN
jgi:hypothetical protein